MCVVCKCNEDGPLSAEDNAEVLGALKAACAAGKVGVVAALLGREGTAAKVAGDDYPLFIASSNGHAAVVELLLGVRGFVGFW